MEIKNIKNSAIVCINDNKIFYRVPDAVAYYRISRTGIYNVLGGKQKTIKGYAFRYANENEFARPVKSVTVQKEAEVTANGTRTNGNCEPCMCISDGMYFSSMADAAEHYEMTLSQISYACSEVGKTAAGKTFCKISDLHLYMTEIRNAINKSNAYDILIAKENARKELVTEFIARQDEISSLEIKMKEMAQQLERAKTSLEAARAKLTEEE